jgi:hypothetical protein
VRVTRWPRWGLVGIPEWGLVEGSGMGIGVAPTAAAGRNSFGRPAHVGVGGSGGPLEGGETEMVAPEGEAARSFKSLRGSDEVVSRLTDASGPVGKWAG